MSLTLLLWLLNLAADTGGQLAFKKAASAEADSENLAYWLNMARKPWIWGGIFCYVAEFFAWAGFLSQVELGVGVMLGSFNIVAIVIGGRFLFNERLTPWRIAGVSLITLGVMLVGVGQ